MLATLVTKAKTKLLNPQIERITARIVAIVSKVSFASACSKLSGISLCDTNSMIRPATAIASSTNHHYGSITIAPVTPEGQVMSVLKVATTMHLTEAHGRWVRTTMRDVTTSSTSVTIPDLAISKVTETGYEVSKGLPAHANTGGVEQVSMRAVVTAGDFDIIALNEPECWWYHVIVVRCTGNTAVRSCSVIPPATAVLHPVCTVSIGEAWYQCPATIRHVTVHLRKQNVFTSAISLSCAVWQSKIKHEGVNDMKEWMISKEYNAGKMEPTSDGLESSRQTLNP